MARTGTCHFQSIYTQAERVSYGQWRELVLAIWKCVDTGWKRSNHSHNHNQWLLTITITITIIVTIAMTIFNASWGRVSGKNPFLPFPRGKNQFLPLDNGKNRFLPLENGKNWFLPPICVQSGKNCGKNQVLANFFMSKLARTVARTIFKLYRDNFTNAFKYFLPFASPPCLASWWKTWGKQLFRQTLKEMLIDSNNSPNTIFSSKYGKFSNKKAPDKSAINF